MYFFQRLAPFQVLSLKDLSRCMIFLNFFIKRISLILDLVLTDERDLEKPYHFEQYPRYSDGDDDSENNRTMDLPLKAHKCKEV